MASISVPPPTAFNPETKLNRFLELAEEASREAADTMTFFVVDGDLRWTKHKLKESHPGFIWYGHTSTVLRGFTLRQWDRIFHKLAKALMDSVDRKGA